MRGLQEVLGWLKFSLERLSLRSDPAIARARGKVPGSVPLLRSAQPGSALPPPAASGLEQNVQCALAETGSAVSRETSGAHCSDRRSSPRFCPSQVAVSF